MNRSIPVIRTLLLTATLGTLLALSAFAEGDGPKALALGAPAPMRDVALKNVDGLSVTLASAAGKKGTLVLFICNHCPYVKAWQGRIAETGNAAVKQGIGVVAINSNDPAAYPEDAAGEMVKRAKSVGYKFPYVVDATSDLARAFGASHTPEAFLFDGKGALVYHGAVDDNAQAVKDVKSHWLADAVAAVGAGKPVATAETKALGCGIKFREKHPVESHPNEIGWILERAPIRAVFATGETAGRLHDRFCLPATGVPATRLPSTSPANRGRWPFEALVERYRAVFAAAGGESRKGSGG